MNVDALSTGSQVAAQGKHANYLVVGRKSCRSEMQGANQRNYFLPLYFRARGSAVGGGVGFRMHAIPASWFGFPARPNQAFHSSDINELIPDLSRRI